jgi:hypothetical protein
VAGRVWRERFGVRVAGVEAGFACDSVLGVGFVVCANANVIVNENTIARAKSVVRIFIARTSNKCGLINYW